MAKSDKPNILIAPRAMTSGWWASTTTAAARWATGPRTSTASRTKARRSPITTTAKLHGGRAAFITGQEPDPHRPDQGRHAEPPVGLHAEDPTVAGAAEAVGLRHRPVRPEPSRRSGRIPPRRTASTNSSAIYLILNAGKSESEDYAREGSSIQAAFRPQGACYTHGPTASGQKIEDTGPLAKKRAGDHR